MGKKIRFGILTIQNLPWEKEVEWWQFIEGLGFDSVWLADHYADPVNPSGNWFESWSLLAALAVVTKKIRFGTLVTSIPLRNPAVLARQALTIDHISNGRLELGIGTGVHGRDPVYEMIGIEDWEGPERVKRFKEQIEVIDRLLRQSISNYDGQFYRLKEAKMNPAPVQKPRPPLTIAAMGDTMLKIAAQYADTWNSYGSTDWRAPADIIFENTKTRVELIDKYCEDIGRNPESLSHSMLFYSKNSLKIFKNEENFSKIVRQYQGIGIDEFIFYLPFYESEKRSVLNKVAEDVIPSLR